MDTTKTGKPLPQIKTKWAKCNSLKNCSTSVPSFHQGAICMHHTYCPKSWGGGRGTAVPVPPIYPNPQHPIGLTVIWLCLGQISSLHWASIFSAIEIAIIWPTHLTEMVRLILKTTIIYRQLIICIRLNYKCFIPIDSCNPHKNPIKYRCDY